MQLFDRRHFLKIAGAGAFALAVDAQAADAPKPASGPSQLFDDLGFRKGFTVLGTKELTRVRQGVIAPTPAKAEPAWQLAQWNSRFTLAGTEPKKSEIGEIRFADRSKSVTFVPNGSNGYELVLELDSAAEYDRLRQQGEPWPHLLASQRVAGRPSLNSHDSLMFHVECRLVHMKEDRREGWSPHVHGGHFVATLSVGNGNRQAPGYGDFLWFGIPIYDTRYRFPKPHFAPDQSHKKFIYDPGGAAYTDQSLHDGQWVTIHRDLQPMIRQGLETAWKRGFLAQSRQIEDFRLTSFSVGWEMPGIVHAAIRMRNLSLAGESKQGSPGK